MGSEIVHHRFNPGFAEWSPHLEEVLWHIHYDGKANVRVLVITVNQKIQLEEGLAALQIERTVAKIDHGSVSNIPSLVIKETRPGGFADKTWGAPEVGCEPPSINTPPSRTPPSGAAVTLLADIEAAAVDSTVPLPDLLRKCKVLAARLKHKDFATWVANELDGYGPDDPLPDYRRIKGGYLIGDYVGAFAVLKGHTIPLSEVSSDLREALQEHPIRDSVGSLANLLSRDDVKLGRPLSAFHTKKYMPRFSDMELLSASQPLDRSDLAGILETVRNRVLEFVLAIEAEQPEAGEAAPNSPQSPIPLHTLNQVFNTTIVSGQANLGNMEPATIGDGNVANGQVSSGPKVDLKELLSRLQDEAKALKVSKSEREEAIEVAKKIEVQALKRKPDLARLNQYIERGGVALLAVPSRPRGQEQDG